MKAFFGFPYRFGKEYREDVCNIISKSNVYPVIADDRFTGVHIFENITNIFDDDELQIAIFDITGLNPNVLIEIGYSYGTGAHTLLLLNPMKHLHYMGLDRVDVPLPIPEDLSGIQRIQYEDIETLRPNLQRALNEWVGENAGSWDQFCGLIRQFTDQECKSTGSILAHVQANFDPTMSYQTVRNWLETLVAERLLCKKREGNRAYYGWANSNQDCR